MREQEIKRRYNETTAGTWKVEYVNTFRGQRVRSVVSTMNGKAQFIVITNIDNSVPSNKDAEFIANAKQDIDYLLKRIKELESNQCSCEK